MILRIFFFTFVFSSTIGSQVKNNAASVATSVATEKPSLRESLVNLEHEPVASNSKEDGSLSYQVTEKSESESKDDQLTYTKRMYEPLDVHAPSQESTQRNRCPSNAPSSSLLQLLYLLLEISNQTPELDKAYQVLVLLNNYLETLDHSQEKNDLLTKLKVTEQLFYNRQRNVNQNVHGGNNLETDKTRVVFHSRLPGLEEPACETAFSKLIQTAVGAYEEVAKHPLCQSSNLQSVFVPNSFTEQPFTFDVLSPKVPPREPYPNQPTKVVSPPNPQENGQTPDYFDLLKQYLNNRNFLPDTPSDGLNSRPSDSVVPWNPGYNVPFSPYNNGGVNLYDLLKPKNQNPSGLEPPFNNPFNPSNVALLPKDAYFYNQFDVPLHNYDASQYAVNPPQHFQSLFDLKNPPSLKVVLEYLQNQANKGGPLEPMMVQVLTKLLNSDKNSNYLDKETPVKTPENEETLKNIHLLDVPEPEKNVDPNALDTPTSNLPQGPSETNWDKLPMLQNNDGFIELTYVLRRPEPVVYHPVFYVKYRLPYSAFMQSYHDLLVKKPELINQPAKLYQALLTLSNVAPFSPDLNGYGKDEVLKLVFNNGALVDAKLVNGPSNDGLKEQLHLLKNLNSNVAPNELAERVYNLLNNSNAYVQNPQENNDQNRGLVNTLLGYKDLNEQVVKQLSDVNNKNGQQVGPNDQVVKNELVYGMVNRQPNSDLLQYDLNKVAVNELPTKQPYLNLLDYKNHWQDTNNLPKPNNFYKVYSSLNNYKQNRHGYYLPGYNNLNGPVNYPVGYNFYNTPVQNPVGNYSTYTQVVRNPPANKQNVKVPTDLDRVLASNVPVYNNPNKLMPNYQPRFSYMGQPVYNMPGNNNPVVYHLPRFNQLAPNQPKYSNLYKQSSNSLPGYTVGNAAGYPPSPESNEPRQVLVGNALNAQHPEGDELVGQNAANVDSRRRVVVL